MLGENPWQTHVQGVQLWQSMYTRGAPIAKHVCKEFAHSNRVCMGVPIAKHMYKEYSQCRAAAWDQL